MASEQPRLPGETHQTLLARGAAYTPLMAGEVSEFRRARKGVAMTILEAVAVIAWAGVLIALVIAGARG